VPNLPSGEKNDDDTMTGTREDWLAARLDLLEAEREGIHAAQRRAGTAAAGLAVGSDRQAVPI
jgi:hypothetical protein